MNKHINAVVASVILSILFSCTSYVAPQIPDKQSAYIKETFIKGTGPVDIQKINNLPVRSFAEKTGLSKTTLTKEFWTRKPGDDEFKIEPKPCFIEVSLDTGTGYATGNLEFIPESGKKYEVSCLINVSGGFFKSAYAFFYIIDSETKLPVTQIPEEYRSKFDEYIKRISNS